MPDQRGYGRTDRPEPIEAYDILQLTGDLVGLLDVLERRTTRSSSATTGVRWSPGTSRCSHPARVRAVAGLSVPFTPRSRRDPIAALEATFAGRFFYILYFQEPGVADAELAADVEATFRALLRSPSGELRSAVVSSAPAPPAGFLVGDVGSRPAARVADDRGPRLLRLGVHADRVHRRPQLVPEPHPQLGADRAPHGAQGPRAGALPHRRARPGLAVHVHAHLDDWVPDLRSRITLPGAGHWVQQERPAEVNAALLEFLGSLD